ncbi:hypothetical protein [Phaeobacter sp. C3_T13_0]|uniref:hypothetical protein n=1 Tax=Phaeobacter cretensis TaxID=3342641 RepID=UPI0039BC3F13
MQGKPHPKARIEPAIVTVGSGNWVPIGFIFIAAMTLLAGCAGPGRYPVSGQTLGAADPVLSLSPITQVGMEGGGL